MRFGEVAEIDPRQIGEQRRSADATRTAVFGTASQRADTWINAMRPRIAALSHAPRLMRFGCGTASRKNLVSKYGPFPDTFLREITCYELRDELLAAPIKCP